MQEKTVYGIIKQTIKGTRFQIDNKSWDARLK